ncbi:hypothetical protein [Blastopirellula marina]|uniref:Uncharacterized protein n=1 Tax=Blastopirellula marina TaxID=124 RepID=A0A2S8GA33_9BACT|nr:hypothetical protein [Blastopirellula marina]PQO41325.1 hypothetical protein C5Y93_29865 [Blastopirellula marina]
MSQNSSEPEQVKRNWWSLAGKIAIYSFFMFCGGTLFAAQYVPEVANALSFLLPEEPTQSCPAVKNNRYYGSHVGTSSCCSQQPSCCPGPACPSEMALAGVEPTEEPTNQLAVAEQPPIPPVVD